MAGSEVLPSRDLDGGSPVQRARPVRVLMVVDALYRNGATRVTLDLARAWRQGGLTVLVRKPLPSGRSVDPDGVHLRFLSPRTSTARWWMVGATVRLVRAVRRADVLVVSGEIGYVVILGWFAARLARRPFVVAVHADLDIAVRQWVPAPLRPLFRAVHRRANGAIVVEQGLAGPVERNGLHPAKVRVVRNGIDVASIRRAAADPDPIAHVAGPRVVVTGRLAREKGTDVMIRAHARIVHDTPHTLVILNDGPDEGALRALAADLGVAESVRFVGPMVPHPVVARSDVFCLPSRNEGLPLALLEAMAVEVPIIAAECSSGVADVLAHGRLGELVPADDVEALSLALRRHLAAPADLRARAAAATMEMDRFTSSAMTEGWMAATDAFVADARATHRRLRRPLV